MMLRFVSAIITSELATRQRLLLRLTRRKGLGSAARGFRGPGANAGRLARVGPSRSEVTRLRPLRRERGWNYRVANSLVIIALTKRSIIPRQSLDRHPRQSLRQD